MRRLFMVAAILLVACGQAPHGTAHSTASLAASQTPTPTAAVASAPAAATTSSPTAPVSPLPQPTTSTSLVFAVLEAKNTPNTIQWNTVAIAGLDGYALAKTAFTPMPSPWVGCAGPVLPLSAQVAAGKVYFADGTGTVRSLSPHGQLAVAATFPLTSGQQMLSFAVSPDGSRLLGAVFTIPPKPSSGDPCPTGAPMFGAGNFTLDVFSADAGGASKLLDHQILPTSATSPVPNVMALLGWDNVGPLATYPTAWATQGGGPHHYNGVPVRIDPTTGKVLNQISDPAVCSVWDISQSGDFLCVPAVAPGVPVSLSIRRPDSSEIWRVAGQQNVDYFLAYLSPDEEHLIELSSIPEVVGRDGSHVTAWNPNGLTFDGWLGSATLMFGGYGSDLDYVSLSSPTNLVDLGFKGLFVGMVQA
jgi:hypothetical protein